MYSFIYYCILSVIKTRRFTHERTGFLLSISAANLAVGWFFFITVYFESLFAFGRVGYPLALAGIFVLVYVVHQRFLINEEFTHLL